MGAPEEKVRMKLHPIRKAKQVKLTKVSEKKVFPLFLDKKSYLLIKIDFGKRELAVGRCTPSHLLTHEFRGKTAKQLSKAILSSGLITRLDHAAYLGRELQRAEIAMRDKKHKYIQDSA